MIVCLCRNINEGKIVQAINEGADTMRALCSQTGIASQCGKCGQCAKSVFKRYQEERSLEVSAY